jgi:hypothetical protein
VAGDSVGAAACACGADRAAADASRPSNDPVMAYLLLDVAMTTREL